MAKTVFISYLHSPVGSTYYLEGMRAALGILSGSDPHRVTMAYIGKGVRSAIKGVDRSYASGMVDLFEKSAEGKRFYVEKESLEKEGIAEKDLDENFTVASRYELGKKMLESDFVLSF
jgi:sulfur relay (sulfurtransferase) DsrF/TusC family protein